MELEINRIAEQDDWEQSIDYLTQDMPAEEIDIKILAERYKEYLDELQSHDFKVSANAIKICSVLLNMKAYAMISDENPYQDNMEEEVVEEEAVKEENEENNKPDLREGPPLSVPVKSRQKRRMHLSELKDSLREALEVKERREERQERRQEIDQQFEMEEEGLETKLNNMINKIKNVVSTETREKINFEKLVDRKDNQEKIEKFKHILHLENDEKVNLIQEEFLGDLEVEPENLEEKTIAN